MSDETSTVKKRSESTNSRSRIPRPLRPHKERCASRSLFLRDSIIGFADGLTVPFALTAGLSSLGSSRLVVLGGLAELFAGSISMGLGAYLAAATERPRYGNELRRERSGVKECPMEKERKTYDIFEKYRVVREVSEMVVEKLKMDEEMWVKFIMDFELKLEKPAMKNAWLEGLIMGLSYFIGGILPMIPYFAFNNVNHALFTSIAITAVILLVFGYTKAMVTGTTHRGAIWSAVQMLVVGALAAAISYGIVRGVSSSNDL